MANKRAPRPSYDVERMSDDMALKTLVPAELARVAGVSDETVYRFLRRERQTTKTAKKLADALGYSVRRYLISAKDRRTGERRDGDRRAGDDRRTEA